MTDGIHITLAGASYVTLHDRIVTQERTIADLQGYLHDAIKAYDALEDTAEMFLSRFYDERGKHTTTLADAEAQKHRITELERSLTVQKEWAETYRAAWSEAGRTAKDRKHKITALTDAHNAQLRINSQLEEELTAALDDDQSAREEYEHEITKLLAAVESQKHVIAQQNETLDLLYDERELRRSLAGWTFRDTEPTERDTPSP